MKVAIFSDIHGDLIKLDRRVDLALIAGDITPFNMENDMDKFQKWWSEVFIPYCYDLGDLSTKIVIIPGNHDKPLQAMFQDGTHELLPDLYLLINGTVTVNGYKIYGNPYFENLRKWAFYKSEVDIYNDSYTDDDIDIQLVHCPPVMMDSDLDYIPNQDIYAGSIAMRTSMRETKPTYLFCGHIHDGDHNLFEYKHFDGAITKCYNVSVKDDNYDTIYKPLYLEIHEQPKSVKQQ